MLASCRRLAVTPSHRAARLVHSSRREHTLTCCSSVRLGGTTFKDVDAGRRAVMALLHKYPVGTVFQSPEHEVLLDVLRLHPRWEQKVGVGVHHFTTDKTEYLPCTSFFVVVRLDGSSEDFSYLKCFSCLQSSESRTGGFKPERRQGQDRRPRLYLDREINSALSRAVRAQLLRFKSRQLQKPGRRMCPVYPPLVLDEDNCCVMYFNTSLLELKAAWFISEGLCDANITLTPGDKKSPQQLTDADMLASWRAFHQEHARYQLMSKLAANGEMALQRMQQQQQQQQRA